MGNPMKMKVKIYLRIFIVVARFEKEIKARRELLNNYRHKNNTFKQIRKG